MTRWTLLGLISHEVIRKPLKSILKNILDFGLDRFAGKSTFLKCFEVYFLVMLSYLILAVHKLWEDMEVGRVPLLVMTSK